MKDKLEKYISDNRKLFDNEEPGDELWRRIAGDIGKPGVKKIPLPGIILKVAAAVILVFASWYIFNNYSGNKTREYAHIAVRDKDAIFIKRKVNRIPEKESEIKVIYLNNYSKAAIIKNNEPGEPVYEQELAEVKAYYTVQINERQNEIYTYAAFNPQIRSQIKIEFSQLDSIYSSLRRDLKDNINNKEVVEAMIQNYMIRMKILENLLQQLKGQDSTINKKTVYEI